ncbi:MAG: DUF960 family protein [Aminipila sp.]
MFDNHRYITRGIQLGISIELQLFMWDCIDELKGQGGSMDYLQVFELSKVRIGGAIFQEIEHRQEEPGYKKAFRIVSKEIRDAKIFVIDDGRHSTMMLAEEY